MERLIMNRLVEWKNSSERKPLVIRGARQIGKTWIMQEFGKRYFTNTVYVNFDVPNRQYDDFFAYTIDPHTIIKNLAILCREPVTPDTLFIFDEIQTCNNALNSLKYFCEDAPEIYVVAAGSLQGAELSAGFPVGKVDFLDMWPMSFEEFLLANGSTNLVHYMNGIDKIEPVPQFFADDFIDKLKIYLTFGGMPEPVRFLTENQDPVRADNEIDNVLSGFQSDFGKHNDKVNYEKIMNVWRSIPEQLAKEYNRFSYKDIKENNPNNPKESSRSREYYYAIDWMSRVNDIKTLHRIKVPFLPLERFRDEFIFKIYMCDVGLLRKMSRLDMSFLSANLKLIDNYKGAMTENYVIQSLLCQGLKDLGYWKDGSYDVDVLIQRKNDIIPVEIKSGTDDSKPSLKVYLKSYENFTKLIVRYSLLNLKLNGKILNIPLYLADKTDKLIGLALDELNSK
ncbi:MAG: ATP-binding protein [Clostridia bacterium]|nr:ATP-binding protein [Clostridia bacterium]